MKSEGSVVGMPGGIHDPAFGALRRRGLRLVAARLAADSAVAEWVIGFTVSIVRRFGEADAAARSGEWAARTRLAGRSLGALTIGIVGVGRIGSQVAMLSRALGIRVIAWHRGPIVTSGLGSCG